MEVRMTGGWNSEGSLVMKKKQKNCCFGYNLQMDIYIPYTLKAGITSNKLTPASGRKKSMIRYRLRRK